MAILAKINPFRMEKKAAMRISDYLDSEFVIFLEVNSRDEAIDQLIFVLNQKGVLPEKEFFRKAILERESLVSTGIGMGVAIPHAKINGVTDFFIAIGIQQNKGLDWNALDKAPVRLVFMIGGPNDRQAEYLQILSLLTSAIRDVELRKKLLKAANVQEVLTLLS